MPRKWPSEVVGGSRHSYTGTRNQPNGQRMTDPLLNLAFGTSRGIGGSERRMLEVVSELTSRGLRVVAHTPGSLLSPLNAEMAAAGAGIRIYKHPGSLMRHAANSHAKATWAFGARAAFPLLVARTLPTWHGGGLLIAKNGLEASRSKRAAALESVLIRSADLVIANSRAAADAATAKNKLRPDRVRILTSALSLEWKRGAERTARADVRVAMIGNDRPEKQHALGLRVFSQLEDPATTLEVFTDDGSHLRSHLLRMDRRLSRRITIHEGVKVTPAIMREVDVLLHPSSSESLPRVALEARSQATWVVGFNIGDLGQYCEAAVCWGDVGRLTESLFRACAAARAGDVPPPVQVLSVSEYTDRLLGLIEETPF